MVTDDLMIGYVNDKRLASLFSKKSHHRNCSVIFIVQNLFVQGKDMRNITKNCHYMILFKNPREGCQCHRTPGQTNVSRMLTCVHRSFHDATSPTYG